MEGFSEMVLLWIADKDELQACTSTTVEDIYTEGVPVRMGGRNEEMKRMN